jgi:hypothetical protein
MAKPCQLWIRFRHTNYEGRAVINCQSGVTAVQFFRDKTGSITNCPGPRQEVTPGENGNPVLNERSRHARMVITLPVA